MPGCQWPESPADLVRGRRLLAPGRGLCGQRLLGGLTEFSFPQSSVQIAFEESPQPLPAVSISHVSCADQSDRSMVSCCSRVWGSGLVVLRVRGQQVLAGTRGLFLPPLLSSPAVLA